MDSSSQKSAVTAQSVMEKIESLSAKASKKMSATTESLTGNNTAIPSNFTESPQSSSFGTVIRYILVFGLSGFILLAVLNALHILPSSLGELLNPYGVLEKPNKETKKSKKEDKIVTAIDQQDQTDKSYNIPQVRRIAQRREVSAPTRLPQPGNPLPKPDISGTRTQAARAKKSGYCYVGEDRGFRSCVRVSSGDKCMSGDIFPTQAVCINPNLRA
jgi:hypothetical protein